MQKPSENAMAVFGPKPRMTLEESKQYFAKPCTWPACSCLPQEQCPDSPNPEKEEALCEKKFEGACEGCSQNLPLHDGLHHNHEHPLMLCGQPSNQP